MDADRDGEEDVDESAMIVLQNLLQALAPKTLTTLSHGALPLSMFQQLNQVQGHPRWRIQGIFYFEVEFRTARHNARILAM